MKMGKSGNPAKANATKLTGTISWFSNSPTAPTGYGMQSNQVLNRMIRDGLDVAVLSNYGREGVNGTWASDFGTVPEYARGAEIYSQDVTPLNHQNHVATVEAKKGKQPNCLVTLYDTWILRGDKYAELNIASWTPIDHNPVPPLVLEWCKKPNVTPIAMSKWGQAQLKAHGVDSLYVPHAVEPVFKPTFEVDGLPVRKYMGIDDDTFLVGMNFANKASGIVHRKAVAEAFLSFALFAKDKPKAVLYLHTDLFGSFGGWKLADLLTACGLRKDQVVFCDQVRYRYGYSQAELAAFYSAMDVLLAVSYGEGFGVGTIEAQACGTPVIVSDICASTELVGDGWLVECQPLWDEAQKSWFSIPNIPQTVAALEEAYARPRGTSQKALDFAAEYDAETVYQKYWLPALAQILK
jgi:glycosyltransferase involved in cell wall biosynthesis